MSLTKPFRGERKARNPAISYIGGAVLLGTLLGVGSLAATENGRASLRAYAKPAAVSLGLARVREPQKGDHWSGCKAAEAAGAAPIYRGEPGYRPEFDGDHNGIACEQYN